MGKSQMNMMLPGEQGAFADRPVKSVTFQGKLERPIHRWYRLTPSFSPMLANDIARHFAVGQNDLVLDPFSGVGTVPLCMKYQGVPSWSVEINPYLRFVSTVKTRTYRDLPSIRRGLADFHKTYRRAWSLLPSEAERYIREHDAFLPRISHPERWWSPGNLMQLMCLKQTFEEYHAEPRISDLIKLGILALIVPVSNAKHNHVSLTFAEQPLATQDVAGRLETKFAEIVADLEAVSGLPCAEVEVFGGNSKRLGSVLPPGRKPTAVITSPPYPNRFSYARETRPHLFFFDFVDQAVEVGQLETDAIGGTWGKATSILSEGVALKNEFLKALLSVYMGNVIEGHELMANYVKKYFNDLFAHAVQIALVCEDRCRLAYVIGNSKFYDNPLPSDEILAAIFEHLGFTLEGISKMRKRQSKAGLYEAVVLMKRVKSPRRDGAPLDRPARVRP
jgi:hypothetical protein